MSSPPGQAQPHTNAPQLPPQFADRWDEAVAQYGDKTMLTFAGLHKPTYTFSYSEIDARVNRLCRALQSQYGVEQGSAIVTVMENRPEQLTLLLACQKLGAIYIPLDSQLIPKHTKCLVDTYEPTLVVGEVGGKTTNFPRFGSETEWWPTLELPPYGRDGNAIEAMETDKSISTAAVPCGANYDKCSMIFSTSGSTGLPKGVMYSGLTCAAIGSMIRGAQAQDDPAMGLATMNDSDTWLAWSPFRGVGGSALTMAVAVEGVHSVMAASGATPDPRDWAHLIDEYDITGNMLFGAAMNQFLQVLPHRTFPTMKTIIYGGSCFPPSLIQKSMRQFPNAMFSQGYGQTEVFPIASLKPDVHDATTKDRVKLRRMASAGKPSEAATIFIEDAAQPLSGQPPADGKGIGQICVTTPGRMMGYWKNPEKTAETIGSDGLVRTGDIGYLDDEGYLHVVDRMVQIIPTHRGYNVAPRDIEEVLYRLPEVAQAAVVGIPHSSGAGEQVVAWVSVKNGSTLASQTVREHLIDEGLPDFQFPDVIEVVDVPLPTTGSKISKKELKSPTYVRERLMDDVRTSAATCPARNLRWASGALPVGIMACIRAAFAPETWETDARALFDRMDTHGTGALNPDDLDAILGDGARHMLDAVDVDRDGVISQADWIRLLGAASEHDRIAILSFTGSLIAGFERSMIAA